MNTENTIEIVCPKNIEFMQLNDKLYIPEHKGNEIICLNDCSISIKNNKIFCGGFTSKLISKEQFLSIINIFKAEQIQISSLYIHTLGYDADVKILEYLFYKSIPFMRQAETEVDCYSLKDSCYNYTLEEIAEDLILQKEYEEILNIEELQKQYPNGGKVKCRYLDENWNVKEREVVILP